ncbi:DUF2892 domain-containing protein [Sulfuriflexus sp.]|uniref:YgaP family membrane protein n=1 Tax=Sulfuriflexus sp. TaxID=2015443 RepID=UPI0028CD6F21|nr:DUF2892 domain-containing protein [Sulfuriflexus sp.]MDT8404992.1 DUF2892 domain-containing protein [Sulfuriflexus sp.]
MFINKESDNMQTNMGKADRTIRILIAIAISVLYYAGMISGTTAIVLGIIAAVLVLTSLVGFCPAYYPFRISTRRKKGI